MESTSRRSALELWLCAAAALLVAACGGGGGGDAGTPSAGGTEQAASFTQGPITGFGSIIVGGVRFDDSAARITDDDDSVGSSADLKLGVVVEIDGSAIDRAIAKARALRIRFGAEIVGPVESIDSAASSLVVLGQTVEVKDTTVFDDSLAGGLSALALGDVLEVHALFVAATGRYVATRIEDKSGATVFRLRGLVADLDSAAKTFKIGGALISYAQVDPSALPNNLANGLRVRVRLQTTQVAGAWVATSVRAGVRRVEDHAEARVHGFITRFDSSTRFAVNGLEVDATNASFPDGTAGLVLGARVEVEGAIVNGVLVASKVEIEDRTHDAERFELHGAIAALDAAARRLVLRGIGVDFAGSIDLRCAAALAVGRQVEVKGFLSPDRTTLVAVRIRCED